MAQPPIHRRRPNAIIDGYDHIEVASIDSFPASDPPGWIEAKAHPCAEVPDGEEHAEPAARSAPHRGAR